MWHFECLWICHWCYDVVGCGYSLLVLPTFPTDQITDTFFSSHFSVVHSNKWEKMWKFLRFMWCHQIVAMPIKSTEVAHNLALKLFAYTHNEHLLSEQIEQIFLNEFNNLCFCCFLIKSKKKITFTWKINHCHWRKEKNPMRSE